MTHGSPHHPSLEVWARQGQPKPQQQLLTSFVSSSTSVIDSSSRDREARAFCCSSSSCWDLHQGWGIRAASRQPRWILGSKALHSQRHPTSSAGKLRQRGPHAHSYPVPGCSHPRTHQRTAKLQQGRRY